MNMDQFAEKFAVSVMEQAVQLTRTKGIVVTDIDAFLVALRREAKASLSDILDDGKALVYGGQTGWLPTLVRVKAYEAATKAVEAITP